MQLVQFHWLLLIWVSTALVFSDSDSNPGPGAHNPLHDVSSPEFRELARQTYAKVLPCVESAWMLEGKNISWEFPLDAAEHYAQLLAETAEFRKAPVHEYAGYEGPWIENIFISKFKSSPLHHFNGLIPLFVQWIDTQILRGRYFTAILEKLNTLLRPNVLYIAISQGDAGLSKIGAAHPNIIALSAGGYGHIILPLIKGEIPWQPPPAEYTYDIAFFGTVRQSNRPQMLEKIREQAELLGMSYKDGYSAQWQEDMESTKFNLAPRGYGRSSFRFAESIQMGRIPVFLYNDYPWIPYLGTNISISTYGFVGGLTPFKDHMKRIANRLHNVSAEELAERLKNLEAVRYYFTYPGVMHQILQFFKDPFGPEGGYLRCTLHPKSETCCW